MRLTVITIIGMQLLFGAGHAAVTAVAGGSPDHVDITLAVTASVASRCGFATDATPDGTYDAADINAGFTHDFPFALQCNCPSRVAVVSANGGLLAPVSGVPQGFSNLAPYEVTLSLTGNAGVQTVNSGCQASTLSGSSAIPCSFRGPASATQGLRLGGAAGNVSGSYLRVSAPPYSGSAVLVAASTYADTLTITLGVAI